MRGRELAEQALVHADRLYHFARYLSGNAADAEDLVQETYARALGRASRFAPGTNLRAWLFAILRNLFLDGRRRAGHEVVMDTVEPEPDRTALRGDEELERLRNLVGAEIERALMALGEDGRTVVLLDLEGMTETEIAQVLSCPVGTVKSRLSRARAALRERLREYAK